MTEQRVVSNKILPLGLICVLCEPLTKVFISLNPRSESISFKWSYELCSFETRALKEGVAALRSDTLKKWLIWTSLRASCFALFKP